MLFRILIVVGLVLTTNHNLAKTSRDTINVVGSSTVFPFSAAVAERFGKLTGFATPKIETTGTGGGMKLFCSGTGIDTPDIANASRRIKATEYQLCQRNGVSDITEVMIGFDGIVFANSINSPKLNISRKEVYLALAREVPSPDGKPVLVPNPYDTWHDINPNFPIKTISVYGPPPTSGTRDAFVELVMEYGCNYYDFINDLPEAQRLRVCHSIREDAAYVESGENDNLVVQKLASNPDAFGVVGFSFLDQNLDTLQGATVDGAEPRFEAIMRGDYPVARSLFFYVKTQHVNRVPGIEEFLAEFTSEEAMGEEGYLSFKGLIPLPRERWLDVRRSVSALEPVSL